MRRSVNWGACIIFGIVCFYFSLEAATPFLAAAFVIDAMER